ncbi:butyrophilin subfamily 1 member A1-like [Aythya fuligula]|uniref:Butyrophilin subfamily 1 member A1-like n=1 Tax=Aythya fuligula TaxID=219594 RepID=A0A6J3EBH3_AYTFU|nr:butyrophilin subfamily 1 member A1-like [Aythya fuligula]
MSPERGIWAVEYDDEELTSLTSPHTPLSLSPVPTRIWVCLDCTQGQVSFINADNGVEIFTFTAASFNAETIRPCLEVRWIRDHISETVHHYRNGEDLYGEQMGAYAGRTELARDGLSAGSLDLRITGLRPSDDGQYVCTVGDAHGYAEAIVELEVSGGYEAEGVRVLCRSAGWYPLPQLLWRDARGQHLPSVSQTHSQDQEGFFEIEGTVIVTGSMEGPLSCVVRNSRLQQEWEFSLHIAAAFFHNAQPWMVALALVLLLLAVSIGLGVYLFRKQDPAQAAAELRLHRFCGCPSLTGHASGFLTSLVTLHLLQLGSAQLRVEGPGHSVAATMGQDIVLPCRLSPQRDAHSLEVRWIRDHISETVLLYRNGEDLYGEQMEAYARRTELLRDGLSAGSLDLRITGLRPSDDGLYVCTVKHADAYDEAIVELEVSATGADPHLSLGGYEDGGVRVLCRSAGWYPLPQLLWRDARGQHLPSVSQTHSQDQEGLFEIEGAVIVTGSMEGPLSCMVRSSRLQQERKFSLHIAAPFFHNAQPWKVALALVLVLLAVSIGLGVYLFRKQAAQSRELAAKKDAELGKQAAEIEEKDARLAWRKFLMSHNTVKVTLDPDTAHPQLVLSQDKSSVRWESEWQQVPDTPERFDSLCCVLGCEEFREGRHCWLVEVEGEQLKHSRWAVGVVRASVERKKWINMSPEEGIWAVQYYEGQLKSLTSPRTPLSLSPVPTRIWVCLDCTQQQVSFINADNGVQIFTFTAASFNGESIRPWLWKRTQGIQLCLKDSTPKTPSPALGGSCPSPDTPQTPLLGPAGAAQE